MNRIATLFLLLLTTSACAQPPEGRQKGSVVAGYSLGGVRGESHQLTVDYFLHPNWSLMYRAGYDRNMMNGFSADYFLPVGATAGVAMLSAGMCGAACGYWNYGGSADFLMYSFFIPDGVSYHFYPHHRVDVSAFVLASGLALRSGPESAMSVYYAPSTGMRIQARIAGPFQVTGEQQFRRGHNGTVLSLSSIGLAVQF